MNKDIRYMHNRSYKRVHRPGLAALPIIFTLLAFGLLLGVVVSMTSTTRVASVSATLANTADYMAESGLRYAAAYYVKTQNDDLGSDDDYRNNTADDDKTLALVNHLNNKTFNINAGQSFHLDVYSFYVFSDTNQTGGTWTLKFPGLVPAGSTFPASGRMIVYDEQGETAAGINYTGRTVNTTTNTITLTGVTAYQNTRKIEPYQQAFTVLRAPSNQTISNSGVTNLTLNNGGGSNFVPRFNGLVKIHKSSPPSLDLLYSRAVFSGATVTLQGLRTPDGSAFTQTVTTALDVSFSRNIVITSEGKAGGYIKKRDFYTPIHSSNKEQADLSILLTTSGELNSNFNHSEDVDHKSVQTLNTSSGGTATFSIIETLGGTTQKHGNLWLKKYNLIEDAWIDGNQKLDYSVQVKAATGKNLAYGGIGLSFRARRVSYHEPNHYLGVSFLKYNLPRIYFREGDSADIHAGDIIVGESSGARGIIVGDPVITRDQSGYNDRGTLRLTNVTGTFSTNEDLEIDGSDVAEVESYTALTADYIPDAIKPFYNDLAHHTDLGPLLLVLWERKGSAWRWLAVKDVTDDYFTAGSQDWNPPEGNCVPGSPLPCPEYDGQIVNDEASLMLRVEEDHGILNGGVSPVKYNIIGVYNGDNSARYSSGVTRAGNATPYDRPYVGQAGNRRKYVTNSSSFPVWPPAHTGNWNVDVDYFSHVEEPAVGGGNQFQWDYANPAVTDETLVINDDGTILYTGLTTPDCSPPHCDYSESEIGLHAFGDVRTNPYATAGFVDFALRLYGEGYQYGGFLNAYMQ